MYKIYFNNIAVIITDDKKKFIHGAESQVIIEITPKTIYKTIEYIESLKIEKTKNIILLTPEVKKVFKNFSAFFKIIPAAGGIVNNNNKILMIYRRNIWDLPKGKVDKSETIKNAAIREVKEECGLSKLKIIRKLPPTFHIYKSDNEKILKKTHWFEMICDKDSKLNPQLSENITDIKWMSKNEITKIKNKMYYSLIDLLEKYFVYHL